MRFFPGFIVWIAAAVSLAAAPIKVVTWNIEYLSADRPPTDKKAGQMATAQSVLKTIEPDVLLTQEVTNWKSMFQLTSVLPGITVDMVSAFPLASPYQRGTIELGIASKYSADSAWFDSWKADKDGSTPPRGYSFCALQIEKGRFLLTYSVHLKANWKGENLGSIAQREESARQLVAHIEEMTKIYSSRGDVSVIVGGDFNTNPTDPSFQKEMTFQIFKDAGFSWCWQGVPQEQRATIPASDGFPDNCFDHVLYRNLRLVTIRVADGQNASDHNPVEAIFEPLPSKTETAAK